ncbi:leucyl aminopeptidase [bacterium]|nr:MAG: leucyl aminopeptidase [bacterium]QQR61751.1 MAG: leucyl aminopeptidase [bacterium]QQR62676.1 MAG: leucyl aminopeptidase [bacterium]
MISVTLERTQTAQKQSGLYVLFFYQGQSLENLSSTLPFTIDTLEAFLQARKFIGGSGQAVSYLVSGTSDTHVLCLGLGKYTVSSKLSVESYRRAVGQAIKQARLLLVSSVTFIIPDHRLFEVTAEKLVHETVMIARMTEYHFDDYISDESRKEHRIDLVSIVTPYSNDYDLLQKNSDTAMIIATGVNRARHWIDTPPVDATPLFMSEQARQIAQKEGMNVTIFGEQEIINKGMGGLAAVSRGSDVDCQMVIMEYKTAKKDAETIALVGKGITFDSGGLSLKPAASMETMKDDMSGAAAVINTMSIIAQLKPDVNVIGIAPLSENLPSGKATKPGDIIRFYNGKTAEVKNTDAEGRLILADALSYAVKHYKLDAIIDIATLTGACAYALGPYFAGLLSQHDELAHKIEKAADVSGDYVWRLPMTPDYQKAIKSEVADICNIGDGRIKAGAITAAHFLQNFVEDVPWAHLDIAGVAFDVPNISYYRSGATGAGVRLFVELVLNW